MFPHPPKTVESLGAGDDTWREEPELQLPRSGLGVATLWDLA